MMKIRSIMLLFAALAISVAMPLRAYAVDLTILDADGLRSFRDEVNAGNDFAGKTIILAADIDLAGEDWVPIGTDETPFAGKFNGGNHTISGLRITTEVMRDLTVSDMIQIKICFVLHLIIITLLRKILLCQSQTGVYIHTELG